MQPVASSALPARLLFISLLMLAGHAIAGSPAGLVITGGNNQAVVTNNAFPVPLSVRLTDSSGDPIENETIEFSVQSSSGAGAVLAQFSVQTDAGGNAQTTATADGVPGSYTVRADIGGGKKGTNVPLGIIQTVDFNLTNLAGTPATATALPASSITTMILLALLLGLVAWRARGTLRQRD